MLRRRRGHPEKTRPRNEKGDCMNGVGWLEFGDQEDGDRDQDKSRN